jgi:SHS2 domain-containing protein
MAYKYFEHEADVGIIGLGSTLEKAFEEAAKAVFNTEVDIKAVKPAKKVYIECSAENEEELFVEWINKLLAEADINDMVFSKFKIQSMKNLRIKAYAFGEKLDQKKHKIKTEVKGATYSMLEIGKKNKNYIAKCIIDV